MSTRQKNEAHRHTWSRENSQGKNKEEDDDFRFSPPIQMCIDWQIDKQIIKLLRVNLAFIQISKRAFF